MQIIGAKKGQQASKPYIMPDNMQSGNEVGIVYGLGEGEILGLVDGGKSIYLDGTPLINDNGGENFGGVIWEMRHGTIDQTHLHGFPAVENETGVNVELRHDRPFVRQIRNTKLSAVVIRLGFGAIFIAKDNGDRVGHTIEYAVDVQTDGGVWHEVLATKFTGKVSQGYKRSHRIDLPTAKSNWTIRVRRLTANEDSEMVGDRMTIDALTEVLDAKLRYPCTALIGLRFNAESFNNIPKFAAECHGMIIQVPSNYDPVGRTYLGLWDGTFKLAYSNNPAWIYYDLCTARRYALGDRLIGHLDKWSLYRVAQYCDEMVDDGRGGREPRYACNVYLQQREDAYKILQNIAGIFHALTYWDGEQIIVDADLPKDVLYTFSRANIIGDFEYSGTANYARHTQIKVAWDDPDNEYKTTYEIVPDLQAIAKYGVKTLDMSAFGCTSQAQAIRLGKWALLSEALETQTVTFSVGLDGYLPHVGSVIAVSDHVLAGRDNGGRVQAIDGNIITLDRSVTKPLASGDMLMINGSDGVTETRPITAINGNKITVQTAFERAEVDAVWAMDSTDLQTLKLRVMSIVQSEPAKFTITGVEYNPDKFAAAEIDIRALPKPVSVIPTAVISAPETVTISQSVRVEQGVSITKLSIDWSQVIGAVAYIVKWRKDDGNWQTLPKVSGQSVDIDGVYAGSYMAQVQAIDAFDNESLATTSQITQITGKVGKLPRLASLKVVGILFGMEIGWSFNKGSEDTNFTEIQVSPDGRSNITTLGTFAYPTDKHTINGLQGNLTQYYRARIVDKLGNVSDWTAWTSGTTEAQADKVLNLLQGQITASQLHQDLSTPIGKIGTLETGLNLIAPKVTSLESSIVTVNSNLANLNANMTAAKADIAKAKTDLSTAIGNITTERNRITNAIRDITALQTANNAKTQEIANLVQTVGNHTSSIRELGVTTGDLAQKYSQIKTQADKSTSDIIVIKQTQQGQATSIERLGAKFDSLSVGGRNLLLNSKKLTPHWLGLPTINNGVATLIATGRLHGMHHPSETIQALDDGKVTISFFAKSNQDGRLHIRLRRFNSSNQMSDIARYITIDSREYKRYVLVFDYTKWTDQQRVNFEIVTYEPSGIVFEIKLPKLEIGTIPTDWTPAPEDIQSDIDTAKTQAEANINTVRETLTNADIALGRRIDDVSAEFKQADNTIKASVQEEITARTNADAAIAQTVNALQSDYSSNKSSVASQIKTLSDKDKSTASQISQITANVTTVQQTANTANSKADTANTKADDGIRRANNAQNKADTADAKATQAKADIVAEQQARADSESSIARQMSALDSKFTNADNAIKASVAQAQQTATNAQQALATAQSQLNAKIDGIDVGGRNLLLGSHATRSTHGTTAFSVSQNVDWVSVRKLVLSADVKYTNARRATAMGAKWFRIGAEIRIIWTDGTSNWYGAWRANVANGNSFHGRVVHKISVPTGKTIKAIDSAKIQIWDIAGDGILVKNAKLELGTIPTDYTPAPEDTQSELNTKASTASLDEFKQAQASQNEATAQRIAALDAAYQLADTTLTARLAHEEQARTSANAALAQNLDSLRSEFNGNKASIDAQLRTLSDKDKATAQQLSQFGASLGQKADATALNDLSTRVTQVDGKITAEVQKISTLQTTIGRHTASIEQHTKSLHGLSAQWTLKVQSGNIVSGIGLASSNGVSDFAVRANKFYIAPPTGTTKTPLFSVVTTPTTLNGVTVPVGNYLSNAFIQNGSITNAKIANAAITSAKIGTAQIGTAHIANGAIDAAKIKDATITNAKIGHAQVDTLQIAGEAVTVPRAQSFDNHRSGLSGQVFSLSMNAMGGSVLVSASFLVDCTNTVSTRSSGHAKAIATINKKLKLVIKCNGSVISERMFTFRDEREKEVSDNSNSGNRPVTATATAFVYDKMVSIINHVHRKPPANAVYTVELHDSGGEGSYVVTNGSVLLLGIKR